MKKRVGPISEGKKGRLMEEKIQQAKMYNMREFSPNQIKLYVKSITNGAKSMQEE